MGNRQSVFLIERSDWYEYEWSQEVVGIASTLRKAKESPLKIVGKEFKWVYSRADKFWWTVGERHEVMFIIHRHYLDDFGSKS